MHQHHSFVLTAVTVTTDRTITSLLDMGTTCLLLKPSARPPTYNKQVVFLDMKRDIFIYPTTLNEIKNHIHVYAYIAVYIYILAYISTQIATVESRSVPRKRTQLINAPLTMEAVLSGAPPVVHNTTAKPLLRVYSIR